MPSATNLKTLIGILAGVALCTSSTVAIATSAHTSNQPSISPFVALSALGSDASRIALCGAAAVGAAAVVHASPQ